MKKLMVRYGLIVEVTLLVLATLFYLATRVDIEQKPHGYFSVSSFVSHTADLHFGSDKGKYNIKEIECGTQRQKLQTQRFWAAPQKGDGRIYLEVGPSQKECRILCDKPEGRFYIASKLMLWQWFVVMGLMLYPLSRWLLKLLLWLLQKVKIPAWLTDLSTPLAPCETSQKTTHVLYALLAIGVLIRTLYYFNIGVHYFQHDFLGHTDAIKNILQGNFVPLPADRLQNPQQPLYYILMAAMTKLGALVGIEASKSEGWLEGFGLVGSYLFLYLSMRFLMIVTTNSFIKIVTFALLVFTPSIVYLSSALNNDVMIVTLAALFFYKGYQAYLVEFRKGFGWMILITSVLFMSKTSAYIFELLLLGFLVYYYLGAKAEQRAYYQKMLWVFIAVGVVLLSFTLYKNFIPQYGSFKFVNSSSLFPGQKVSISLSYYLLFDPFKLFSEGVYRGVFMATQEDYLFINHMFRTFLIGEYDMGWYIWHAPYLKMVIIALFAIGLVWGIGFLRSWFALGGENLFMLAIIAGFVLNILSVVNFVASYSVTCNSDFRYVSGFYIPAMYLIAVGLSGFKSLLAQKILYALLALYGALSVLFLATVVIA